MAKGDSGPLSRQSSARPSTRDSSKHPSRIARQTSNIQDGPRTRASSGTTDGTRTEAVWAEMQNTLEEVELSASGGASAFSAEHGRALEDLRKAQIALAQAWARSEAEDDGSDEIAGDDNDEKARAELGAGRVLGDSKPNRSTERQDRNVGSSNGNANQPSLEEETVNDILLARKRREANDRYFEKVNRGVIDVVEKLDVVAKKMRGVEMEAQDLWDSQSSLETGGYA